MMSDTHKWKPVNDRIDYERVQALEKAIRAAAETFGWFIINVHLRSDAGWPAPRLEIELEQQPATYAKKER